MGFLLGVSIEASPKSPNCSGVFTTTNVVDSTNNVDRFIILQQINFYVASAATVVEKAKLVNDEYNMPKGYPRS